VSTYLRPFRALGVAPPAAPPVPKVRRLTSWMLRHPDDIDSDDCTGSIEDSKATTTPSATD